MILGSTAFPCHIASRHPLLRKYCTKDTYPTMWKLWPLLLRLLRLPLHCLPYEMLFSSQFHQVRVSTDAIAVRLNPTALL